MTYPRLILANSILIGAGIAIAEILAPHTIFYLIPTVIYSFSFLLNKRLRSKPLILGTTVALGWLIAIGIVLSYVRLRTCDVGSEEWFCDVDGLYGAYFMYFGFLHTALIVLIGFVIKVVKLLSTKSNK